MLDLLKYWRGFNPKYKNAFAYFTEIAKKGLATSGVGELTKSIVQLGRAILTNPILLLAAVIIGLVALVIKFADKIKPVRIAMELVGQAIDFVIQKLKDFSDWLGITDFEGEEKANNTLANAEKEQTAIERRYDQEIAMASAAGEDTVELEKKKEKAVRESIQKQIDSLYKLQEINGKLTDDQNIVTGKQIGRAHV